MRITSLLAAALLAGCQLSTDLAVADDAPDPIVLLEGGSAGLKAPALQSTDQTGAAVSLASLTDGSSALVVFYRGYW